MTTLNHIRDAFNRIAHVYGKRPAAAQFTGAMRCRLVEGLRCEVQEGDWRAAVDMPVDAGGTDQGPRPRVYGRAALASCLAIGYAMYLARAGIAVRSLEVEVQTDGDYRGLFGFAEVNPGYHAVRHTLYLECDAAPDEVQPVLEQAQRASPYLHVFGEPQPLSGTIVFGPRPGA